MFWSWVPLELFIALSCDDRNALIIVPVVLLIWALETRWIWMSGSELPIESKRDDDEVVKWARRGRMLLFLYCLVANDEPLQQSAMMSRESFGVALYLAAAINQINPIPKHRRVLHLFESLCWTITFLVGFQMTTVLKPFLFLALHLTVVGVAMRYEEPSTIQNAAPATAPEILPLKPKESGTNLATPRGSGQPSISMGTSARRKNDEDGALLIQAMAPQIVLDMLSDSDIFVSALCERNGTFRWVSNSIEKLYGYSKDELIGTSGWSTVHPDDVTELMTRNRDTSNKIRLEFRRRRKDGSYVHVQSFGLYNEGFFFLQEYIRGATEPEFGSSDSLTPTQRVARLASQMFSGSSPVDPKRVEELMWLHEDMSAISTAGSSEKMDLSDCVIRVVNRGVSLRDARKQKGQTNVRFRAVSSGVTDTEDALMVSANPTRLYRALVGTLEAIFEQEMNQEVRFCVSPASSANVTFSFTATSIPEGDVRIESAKSLAQRRHRGSSISRSDGALTGLELTFDFSGDASVATCLIVDDDEIILRMMQKRLGRAWKVVHGTELKVLTARTGQEAIEIAGRFQSNSLSFVCVDLNLDENSVYTGTETVSKLKAMGSAKRVVVLTATAGADVKIGDGLYLKGSPELYESLCIDAF